MSRHRGTGLSSSVGAKSTAGQANSGTRALKYARLNGAGISLSLPSVGQAFLTAIPGGLESPPHRGGDLKSSPSPCPLPQGGEGFTALGEGRVGGSHFDAEELMSAKFATVLPY